ncbi:MAG: hypothetical protein JJU00_15145, partial [Opitutales bacterium]|nr:hypothetical protein [Opitutales bacterium]
MDLRYLPCSAARACVLAVLLSFTLGHLSLRADEPDPVLWTGAAGDGLWSTDGNWDPHGVPGSNDEVVIPAGAEVVVPASASVKTLTLDGSLWVRGESGTNTLSVSEAFLNRGSLRLESINSSRTSRVSLGSGAVLVNEGMIVAEQGTGGNRSILGSVTNWGTITAGSGTTFVLGGSGDTILQEPGATLEGIGTLEISGSNALLHLTGGTTVGEVVVDGSDLRVGAGLAEQTVIVRGSSPRLLEKESPAVTVWVRGESGTVTLNTADGLVNRGTLRLESINSSRTSRLSVMGGGTLINEGTIEAHQGTGGDRSILGNLVNRGTLRAGPELTWELGQSNRRVTLESGVLEGDVVFMNGELAVLASFPGQTVEVRSSMTLLLQESPDVEIWFNPVGSTRTLTIPDGFVNPGTIRIESTDSRNGTLSVIDDGTLINEGTIEARPGTGGNRTLNTNLINRGTVRADGTVFDVGNSGRSVVLEEGGAFDGTGGGELVLDNAAVRLVGGEMRDGSRLNGGSLRVESTVPAQEVEVLRGFGLLQLDSPSVTVWAGGQPGTGSQFVTVPDGFVNRGILRLERADATSNIIVSVEDNGTFTNKGVIEARQGTGG